jgi:transcriptional regulator with XRE-family HTH domain
MQMIGQRLRDLREDADMTQEQLGKLAGLQKHSISAFELGKQEPGDEAKIAFAKHFNVSVDYLLGLTNNPKPIWDDEQAYIKLPHDCPPELRKEAEEYIKYLTQKYKA